MINDCSSFFTNIWHYESTKFNVVIYIHSTYKRINKLSCKKEIVENRRFIVSKFVKLSNGSSYFKVSNSWCFYISFQFLISIVCTDFLMALIVVPLEMKHIFYGLDSDNSTSNGTTFLNYSSHHLAGNGENQNTDEMIVATNSESETVSVSCQTQVFFHLFVICTRSWSIAAFILLHHMHDGIIPVGSLVEFQVTKN